MRDNPAPGGAYGCAADETEASSDSPGADTYIWHVYAVTPDGNRFLVAQPFEESGAEPLTLVQNWASELER